MSVLALVSVSVLVSASVLVSVLVSVLASAFVSVFVFSFKFSVYVKRGDTARLSILCGSGTIVQQTIIEPIGAEK